MKKRILLAEDNKDVADIITAGLTFLGYEVVVAKDGIEAVQSAINFLPDIIVMDMLMPKLDGFEAVAQLRRHVATKSIPILAATALARTEDRRRCLASGCDDCIVKPFTTHTLAAAVEKLLGERASGQSKENKTESAGAGSRQS
jgi:CheY-like chemotaxis protein